MKKGSADKSAVFLEQRTNLSSINAESRPYSKTPVKTAVADLKKSALLYDPDKGFFEFYQNM